MVEATVTVVPSATVEQLLRPHRRGAGDPAFRRGDDGALWRTTRPESGPATCRLAQRGDRVHCEAWGAGAAEAVDGLAALLGAHDRVDGFAPQHPVLADAHRRCPGLRIGRTDRVLEALVPAILEQRVHSVAAFASWRRLLSRFGEPAPGPAPAGMRVPPSAEIWRAVPSWEFHRANVDPRRARAIVGCAQRAARLEATTRLRPDEAQRRLCSLSGVGQWTAAEVAQRAFGDADALSVGDLHLAPMIGWTLLGRPLDDAGMLEYLEPLQPHRYRAVRLLEVSGAARLPRFGPRTPVTDHRGH
ncbi:DNA-3-methyladenine glycosylase family protein [Speluncibacter jeojiensis]|uniref:DNA-3-methyladenine glycosylase family protein n=1 Tax=Speluncibacter jeojiensis TaxID=2710754 RepID=UPI00240FD76B|nr:DNA-3-methyladenine glycosylase 2 family protein [Rhodococcus sp. D2-41]